MTVSPRRAPDGERQTSDASTVGEMAAAGLQPELPPTLFKLPSLHAATGPSSADAPSRQSEPGDSRSAGIEDPQSIRTLPPGTTYQPSHSEPMPQATAARPESARSSDQTQASTASPEAPSSATSQVPAPTSTVGPTVTPPVADGAPIDEAPIFALPEFQAAALAAEQEPAATNEAAFHSTATNEETAPSRQQPESRRRKPIPPLPTTATSTDASSPAGRSWMERIQSHSLVVIMLLLVIAAAMFTSRINRDPSDLDDSVASGQADALQFDSGEPVELPISDADLESYAQYQANQSLPVADLASSTTNTDVPALPLGSDSPAAELNRPAIDPSAVSPAAENAEGQVVSLDRRIEVNQYSVDPQGVDATTVSGPLGSTKSSRSDDSHAVPTLEELESRGHSATPAVTHDGPTFSRTPFAIRDSDWLKYLDALIQEGEAATAAQAPTVPPTSVR